MPVAPSTQPTVLGDGLKFWNLKIGTGMAAVGGMTIKVNYTGWLKKTGKKFDSSLDAGEPLTFVLGKGRVIKGWEEGVRGMRVGGIRRLEIPPELAYGIRGAGQAVPPNSTLIFEVEVLDIE